jgi:hypothetical protein
MRMSRRVGKAGAVEAGSGDGAERDETGAVIKKSQDTSKLRICRWMFRAERAMRAAGHTGGGGGGNEVAGASAFPNGVWEREEKAGIADQIWSLEELIALLD